MKLPWQKSDDLSAAGTPSSAVPESAESADEKKLPKGYTPPKGRPTPRRRDVETARGIRRDPSSSPRGQARQDRKALKASMTKEEWKAFKARERQELRARQHDIQAAIDRGDERYMLPRDHGKERAFARDWIDSRRALNNFVMPTALFLLLVMFLGGLAPELASIISYISMALILAFFIEGILLGRRVNKAVREKFPDSPNAGWGLGFYTYSRATQPRRWRSPKPRVKIGHQV
ncbi:DUF3043 domain-containing protein [Corynebacterium caspium]|uniref:DUF3043 domain-containing protein n=1 Tax=Corynebacterium caspium TaxID=234828 RepID=UPI000364AB1C|nr:DUF3043 domain-containing protein [Corynebacterium caspium]